MSAVLNEVQVGQKTSCVFGIVTDDHDYREEKAVSVLAENPHAFLVDDENGLMGRAYLCSDNKLHCVITMNYGQIRSREEAARMLQFSI